MNKGINFLNSLSLEKNEPIVVAVSGGPDSMFLLNLLLEYSSKYPLKLICAHVNHKVRKESFEEAQMVQKYCEENGIFFEYFEILEYSKENFHTYARNLRYDFFETVLKKYHSKYLMTAHHGDDLMETVLMRIVRGSSLKGYSGIERVSKRSFYTLVRPLLTYTKSEILELVQKKNIPYRVDASNEKDVYTRNRYRKKMLPFLKEENDSVHLKFLEFSEKLSSYYEYVDKEVKRKYENIAKGSSIQLSSFLKEDPFLQEQILYYFLEEYYQKQFSKIQSVHVENLLFFIHHSKVHSILVLPNGVQVLKTYSEIQFLKEKFDFKPYEILIEEDCILPNGGRIQKVEETDSNSNFICRLSKETVSLPLYARTRREKDRMEVKGLSGTKKVKDIFIDEKIPLEKRDSTPIVCDQTGKIVWIPGIKKSKFDKQKGEKYDIILRYDQEGEFYE